MKVFCILWLEAKYLCFVRGRGKRHYTVEHRIAHVTDIIKFQDKKPNHLVQSPDLRRPECRMMKLW